MSRFRKYVSLLLTVILVLTLVPPLDSVSAAPNLEIQSWATAADDGTGNPDWSKPAGNTFTEPSKVTTKRIDVEVDFTEIADEDISKLYYQVYNTETQVLNEVKDNPAIRVGTQKVRFEDVELTEGLNKITVILDTPSKPQSLPAWIIFTEVSSITDLKINDEQFSNGKFVPTDNPPGQNTVFIDGVAPNSTEVLGFTYGNSDGVFASFFYPETGEFSFSAGENNVDLIVRPGDNHLFIEASNPFKTYRAEREFIYNNGQSFLYNTEITNLQNLDNTNSDNKLFKQPTLRGTVGASGNTFSFDVETDVKINKNGGNAVSHPTVELTRNGSLLYTLNFNGSLSGSTTTVDILDDTGTLVTTATVGLTEMTDYFLFTGLTVANIEMDTTKSHQALDVNFKASPGFNDELQSFIYFYVNDSDPYVDYVRYKDQPEPKFFSGMEINITSSAIDLWVKVEQGTDEITVETANRTITSNNLVSGNAYIEVTLNKEDLPEGQSILKFIPHSGGVAFPAGGKEYLVNYNPSPYVYLTNVYNGQIFTKSAGYPQGKDGSSILSGPIFQIMPVNIPEAQWGDIRVRFNENSDLIQPADHYNVSGTFQEFRFYFGGHVSAPANRADWELVNGLNTLIIEIYPQDTISAGNTSVKPITTFKYELFYYEDNVPEIHKLDLKPSYLKDDKFVQIDGEDYRYYTQANEVEFEGAFRNATEVTIVVNRFDEDGDSVTDEATYTWNGSSFVRTGDNLGTVSKDTANGSLINGTISSARIPLYGTGTNSIEVIVTNPSGLFSTRLLEIIREPAAYTIHYPQVDVKTGVGTINGNFTRMYVEAEGADKIIYDKNKEIAQTETVELDNTDTEVFIFELKGLKKGNNKVKFTVVRGTREDEVEITLINTDTPVVGAQYKESISKNRIKTFNNQLELKFPKGTVLKKNDDSASDQFLSPSRDILLGIADPVDGRVNKALHPLRGEDSIFDYESDWDRGYLYLLEPTGRFKTASPLYWIDAGTVPDVGNTNETLYGSGVYPYERDQEFYQRKASNYDDLYVPSQPGELILAYDSNIVQSAWRYVTVYHYGYNEDHLGNKRFEWKNIGGVVDTKKNTITVPIQEFGYYRVMYMDRSFDDVINHPWARASLETLYSKGMMIPKEQNRFTTNEPITRGEFATLLVKAFDIPLNYKGEGTFSDVRVVDPYSFGLYEYKYIETAARAGIVRGSLGGRFLPRENITREDAAVMIARAANLKLEQNTDRARQQLEKAFTDINKFDTYAMPSVLAVNKAKLIEGKPNAMGPNDKKPTYYYDPKANLTRAEAAAVMMRVLLNAKKIPHL